MQKEINMLNQVTNSPKSPFIVILGGAKVSDKISVIDNLKQKANTFVIGGGMAATFIYALGYKTGKSPIETDYLKFAKDLILESQDTDFEMILPKDVRAKSNAIRNGQSMELYYGTQFRACLQRNF